MYKVCPHLSESLTFQYLYICRSFFCSQSILNAKSLLHGWKIVLWCLQRKIYFVPDYNFMVLYLGPRASITIYLILIRALVSTGAMLRNFLRNFKISISKKNFDFSIVVKFFSRRNFQNPNEGPDFNISSFPGNDLVLSYFFQK